MPKLMQISLSSDWRRSLFLILIVLAPAGLIFGAGKAWLAAHWAASSNPDAWFRAAKLEPGNAEYWHRLGLLEEWDFERGDPHQAILYLRRATETNPRSDMDWMDLASAYESVGKMAPAQEAFERAKTAYPASAEVAWRYGSFLVRRGGLSEAFAEIRRALATDPNLTFEALSECWKASADVPRILHEVLPAEARYYLTALDYFLAHHQADAALTVWNGLLALKQRFEMQRAVPLVDELISEGRFEEAQRAWQQALVATNWPQYQTGDSSLVFNGGFEGDLLNGGFDWRKDAISGAAFSLDSGVVHSGEHSLRIAFDGSTNLDFAQFRQWVPVEPSRRYRFQAYVRTEAISTDSGIRFALYDVFHPAALQILTANLLGTHPWSVVETELTTNPETRLLAIVLRRIPSGKFDNKLRGTVWVDDVALVPISRDIKDGSP
jgi:tetratricopeptide (TPR) repeat protein